jgi:tetratricopeptide (TPR) repeat protein
MPDLRFLRSVPVLVGTCITSIAATSAQFALANPPLGWPKDSAWLATPPNPWALLTAILAGLSAWASIAQLRAPRSATPDDVRSDGDRTRKGVEHVSQQVAKEGMLADRRHEEGRQSIAELHDQIRALAELVASSGRATPSQSEALHQVLTDLADSGNANEVGIAHLAASGDPLGAADQLMAEAGVDRRRSAERMVQAARIYAAFVPEKAIAAYSAARSLDPEDAVLALELARLLRDIGKIDQSNLVLDDAIKLATSHRVKIAAFGDLAVNRLLEFRFSEAEDLLGKALNEADTWITLDQLSNDAWFTKATLWNQLATVFRAKGDEGRARELSTSAEGMLKIALAGSDVIGPGSVSVIIEDYVDRYDFEGLRNLVDLSDHDRTNLRNIVISLADTASRSTNDPVQSQWCFDLAESVFETLRKEQPSIREVDTVKMYLAGKMAVFHCDMGDMDLAELKITEALSIAEERAALSDHTALDDHSLAVSNWNFSDILFKGNRFRDGMLRIRKADEILNQLAIRFPENPRFLLDLARVRGDQNARVHPSLWRPLTRILVMCSLVPAMYRYLKSETDQSAVRNTFSNIGQAVARRLT